jgi:iron complex outermembrane receptor protein
MALGGAYRTEHYSELSVSPPSTSVTTQLARRNIAAEYGEIRVPIFSALNAVPGIEQLTLSAAIRNDHYSDFGNTTNPKFGVSWFPVRDMELRGAYSTSFRPPSTGIQLADGQEGTTGALLEGLPGPNGSARTPVLLIIGATPDLRPETAKNLTFGFDYKPSYLSGLHLSGNYYNIDYSNQISGPPASTNPLNTPAVASLVTQYPPGTLQSLVNSIVQNGHLFLDITRGAFGANAIANTVWLYDERLANLSSTKTSGFDFGANYLIHLGTDEFNSAVNLTYIDRFLIRLTPSAPQFSAVNTIGYPARVHLRGQETWTHGDFNLNLAANYVGGYPDTSSLMPRNVGAYTTVDIVGRYDLINASQLLRGVSATIAALNLLDRQPPYVVSGTTAFVGSHYDPANASPLGRMIVLSITKRW